MTSRRNFLLGIPASTLLASPVVADALGLATGRKASEDGLDALMLQRLVHELGDRSTAVVLLPLLFDAGFNWSVPQISAGSADSVIAYSFGNRLRSGRVPTDADRLDDHDVYEPGPINARLADAVYATLGQQDIPVYAQWEIAEILADKYGMKDVQAIHSLRDGNGKKVYLSTGGVAQAVVSRAGSAAALGHAAVIGHRDHVKRCILVSRNLGIEAGAPAGVSLPFQYDSLSGQPWTRKREVYLLGDVIGQLSMVRAQMLGELSV